MQRKYILLPLARRPSGGGHHSRFRGGTLVSTDSLDDAVPGLYETVVRLGPTRVDNVFEIQVGKTVTSVTMTAR